MPDAKKSTRKNIEPPETQSYRLQQMGFEKRDFDYIIALAGNPNTGKSTVFNNLTGLRQHTGNWPGKTVTQATGTFEYRGKKFKVVDLPGTYSLLAISEDEEIARDFILFGRPDVTVIVVDATVLERNLNLVLQVLEITDRVVIDLNLMDEAKRHQIIVDTEKLSIRLGVPVVPTAARYDRGMEALISTIYEVAIGEIECNPYRIKTESPALKAALEILTEKISSAYPNLPNPRWVALRILDGDESTIEAFQNGEFELLNQNNINGNRKSQ